MFTADPITSDRTTLSIDAGFGLGEALVSGLANADNYKVRDGGCRRQAGVADRRSPSAPRRAGEPRRRRSAPSGSATRSWPDPDILQIGRASAAPSKPTSAGPQDIEWSYADGTFFVLQSRPITTLFPIPGPQDGKNHVYMSFGHQQMMTDAMKPLGLSFFQEQFDETPLFEAGGRFYIDLAPDLASPVGRRLVLASMAQDRPAHRQCDPRV